METVLNFFWYTDESASSPGRYGSDKSLFRFYQAIHTKHILCAGRWMLVLFAPLTTLATGLPFTAVTWAVETLFVINAILCTAIPYSDIATTFLSRKNIATTWATVFAALDIVLVTTLGMWAGTQHAQIWLLYLWCVTETALGLRSKMGFAAVLVVDALSLLHIVPWWPVHESIPTWLLHTLLFNFSALPLLFLAYWETRQRHTLENRVKELSAQIAKTKELEIINRQMTDYAMDVQNRAVIDQLTGLFNQTYFHHRLIIEFEKARQADKSISLIIIDIDHFKRFNDQFGHYIGDDVLQSVARVLLDFVADRFWVAGRIGGEEMAILLPEITLEEVSALAERLRRNIAGMIVPGPSGPLRVTVSAGVASWPGPAKDAADLTKQADQAMYTAKDRGRNRVCLSEAL